MRIRYLLIILVAALIPRLCLFAVNIPHPERWITPDSVGYHNLGYNLLHHGTFSQSDKPPLALDYDRVPIYPLYVSMMYAISGNRDSAVIFSQLFLSAATCWFLFLTVRQILGQRWALAAALAQAFSLSSIVACQYLLTETLFTLMLSIQLYLAILYKETGRNKNDSREKDASVGPAPSPVTPDLRLLTAATILLGLMTLCRPISLLWIIPQCFLLLCETRLPILKRLTRIALSIALFALVLFPWMLRNRIQDGAWFLTTNAGYTVFFHNVAALEARRTGQSAEKLRQQWDRETQAEFAANPQHYRTAHEQNAYRMARAKEKIRQAPFLYARLHFQPYILLPNITSFFELIGQTQPHRGTLDVLNREGLLAAVRHYFGNRTDLIALGVPWIILLMTIYAGVCLGLLRWLLTRNWINLLLFLAFAEYYLLLPGPVTLPRYREPAMPMLILTAAVGLAWIGKNKNKELKKY